MIGCTNQANFEVQIVAGFDLVGTVLNYCRRLNDVHLGHSTTCPESLYLLSQLGLSPISRTWPVLPWCTHSLTTRMKIHQNTVIHQKTTLDSARRIGRSSNGSWVGTVASPATWSLQRTKMTVAATRSDRPTTPPTMVPTGAGWRGDNNKGQRRVVES